VLGQNTAKQPIRKLAILRPDTILGVTGPVGFSQRIGGVIGALVGQQTYGSIVAADKSIREKLWTDIFKFEFEIAQVTKNVFPQMAQECLCGGLIALPVGQGLELIQFNQTGATEQATDDLPFASIGSGQPTADPFLAFIRRIFWATSKPTLAEGIFAVWWTLHHCITVSPGGIADPKQMVVLEIKNKKAVARELTDAELKETEEVVARAEQYLKGFDRSSGPSPPAITRPIPEPPVSSPIKA
jgi:hypothetical protein